MPQAKPIAAASRRHPHESSEAVHSMGLRSVGDGRPAVGAHEFDGVTSGLQSTGSVSLTAALLAVRNDAPVVLTALVNGVDTLPCARFELPGPDTLEACLRDGIAEQTSLSVGHIEQLQAFIDHAAGLGIGYLALTRATVPVPAGTAWRSWFDFLPWEDWRQGRPAILTNVLEPRLRAWAESSSDAESSQHALPRAARIRVAFGLDRTPWNDERVVERLELMMESGLVESLDLGVGTMPRAHLRVLANGIAKLRTMLKTRPVIFELMDHDFTLYELQKAVEAILGPHLHKQNFRRLVESAGLVEPTGEVRAKTGGRPAKLFRFRQEVLMERPAAGVRVHAQRANA